MDIIELANESGLTYYGMGKDRARFIYHLEYFANLVATAARADEREECAAMCMAVPRTGAYFARLIRARGTT